MQKQVFGMVLAICLLGITSWVLFEFRGRPDENNRQSVTTPLSAVSSTLSPTQESVRTREPIELVFVGDIMLDRDVWSKMERFGADYPFRKVGDLFAGDGLVIGNLEGPVTERGSHAVPYGNLLFKFDPSAVQPLREAGVDAVSLANNHTFNQGKEGLFETRVSLQADNIASFGDPQIVTVDNLWKTSVGEWQLALIGWNQIEISDDGQDQLFDIIRTLEADSTIDAIIVLPHWGSEYQAQTTNQVEAAHGLIEAGVDLIIGAHPHVVQGVEVYQDRFIAYSLGNFIFDQYWSEATQRGLVVRYRLSEAADEVTLMPITLAAAQPTPATDADREDILTAIANLSHPDLRILIEAASLEVAFD